MSPHLDDVGFSCGGTLIALGQEGWRTVVVTAFTASHPGPTGFALACQLDKGLGADVDYLALRRAEDDEFAERAGVSRSVRLDLLEAPHRGYHSAPELFGPLAADDDVWRTVASGLRSVMAEEHPDRVFAPQALGDHVDHRQVVRAMVEAVADTDAETDTWWYRDTPYAMRVAPSSPPDGRREVAVAIDPVAKARAAAAYATQLGFQFGGTEAMAVALTDFARAEGWRSGSDHPVETFLLEA